MVINDKSLEILFEYNGCFWHGCKDCFKDGNSINPRNNKPYKELYNKCIERKEFIINEGYNYIEIREHEDKIIRDKLIF